MLLQFLKYFSVFTSWKDVKNFSFVLRYALLVGQPPFETDTLKETYSRITTNKYVIPPLISEPARHLIRSFLHPDPNARPRLDQVLSHEFFTTGMSVTCHIRYDTFAELFSSMIYWYNKTSQHSRLNWGKLY